MPFNKHLKLLSTLNHLSPDHFVPIGVSMNGSPRPSPFKRRLTFHSSSQQPPLCIKPSTISSSSSPLPILIPGTRLPSPHLSSPPTKLNSVCARGTHLLTPGRQPRAAPPIFNCIQKKQHLAVKAPFSPSSFSRLFTSGHSAFANEHVARWSKASCSRRGRPGKGRRRGFFFRPSARSRDVAFLSQ
jgi:hypothetical protein